MIQELDGGNEWPTKGFEALNWSPKEPSVMERLIINGDPGIRKGAVIRYDDQEVTCFSITRNGDYHGPNQVQLWCVVGDADESGAFERREFVPHFLDTQAVDAESVEVVTKRGEITV